MHFGVVCEKLESWCTANALVYCWITDDDANVHRFARCLLVST